MHDGIHAVDTTVYLAGGIIYVRNVFIALATGLSVISYIMGWQITLQSAKLACFGAPSQLNVFKY